MQSSATLLISLICLLVGVGFSGCRGANVKESETKKAVLVRSEASETAGSKKKNSNLSSESTGFSKEELVNRCRVRLAELPGAGSQKDIDKICGEVQILPRCKSVKGEPIFHYNKSAEREHPERILTFALVHGDELPSGTVALNWMRRLMEISPRNEWRVVPVLNPDGMAKNTRMNANGIDINRNFPSKDWEELAVHYWKSRTHSDPRRFPGNTGGSEPETQCAMDHLADFRPDLVIAVHTPYGVLDFDGPRLPFPKFKGLPWVSLGTYPGSLGRYMWTDQNRPVLTIELKQDLKATLDRFDQLQDISGQVALQIRQLKE
ncbi:MAG: DUF2817 domain-containing protein [Bdellovibrionales bacterium]|nr:DUF2817 domain-containing protein [Bdellovibrionales bacterium]